jgi:hypothetical protein
MRAAAIVARGETVDAENPQATTSEVPQSATADSADAEYDAIEMVHGQFRFRECLMSQVT